MMSIPNMAVNLHRFNRVLVLPLLLDLQPERLPLRLSLKLDHNKLPHEPTNNSLLNIVLHHKRLT